MTNKKEQSKMPYYEHFADMKPALLLHKYIKKAAISRTIHLLHAPFSNFGSPKLFFLSAPSYLHIFLSILFLFSTNTESM